jgi:gamma-glutamylputrescine oxidase
MDTLESLWSATSNLRKNRDPLTESKSTDVVVIGGGFTGLSTAYFLNKFNRKVIILEKERVGWGASGRNAGMLTTGFKKGTFDLEKRVGKDKTKELLDMSKDCIKLVTKIIEENDIQCSLEKNGGLKAAYKPSHFEKIKKDHEYLKQQYQYETELVDPNQMKSEIDSPLYQHGGLIDSQSYAFHPLNYAIGLASIVEDTGTIIYEKTCVTQVRRNNSKYLVQTEGGASITCDHVVIGTNGYTTDFAKKIRKSILPIGSHIIATEPLPDHLMKSLIPNRRVLIDTKNMLFYFRPTADQRMLFGGRVSFKHNANQSEYQVIKRELEKNLHTVFPPLKGMKIDHHWGGVTGFTMDFMPHIGVTEEGIHFAVGYCGHGAAMSTLFGKILANKIANTEEKKTAIEELPLQTIPLHGQTANMLNIVGYYYKIADAIS